MIKQLNIKYDEKQFNALKKAKENFRKQLGLEMLSWDSFFYKKCLGVLK